MASILKTPTDIEAQNDSSVRKEIVKEMSKIKSELDKSLSDMAKEVSKMQKGTAIDIKRMSEAVKLQNQAASSFEKLSEQTGNWVDTTLYSLKQGFVDSKRQLDVYTAYFVAQQERMERRENKREQEQERLREKHEKIQRQRQERFYSKNEDIISAITENLGDTSSSIIQLLDDMGDTNEKIIREEGTLNGDISAALYKQQQTQLESLISQYEETYESIKETIDEDTREIYESTLDEWKKQVSINNQYIKGELEDNKSILGKLFKVGKEGMNDMNTGMHSFKDIFDSLNLHMITKALTGGADTLIDVMSEVSRIRGIGYDDTKSIKGQYSPSDTFGGKIGASEIMKVYNMNNLTEDYLSDISSTVAMFEKETGVGNESLNGMLLWMQNSGINRNRTIQTLDTLQGIRDNGGDVQEISEWLSKVGPLLGEERLDEAAKGMALLQSLGLEDLVDEFQNIILNSGNVNATGDVGLINATSLSRTKDEIQRLYNSGDLLEMAKVLSDSYRKVSESVMSLPIENRGQAVKNYGIDPILAATLAGEKAISEEAIINKIEEIRSDTSTVANNTDSAGFVDNMTEAMNKASTTWLGDAANRFEEFMQNHPIMASFGSEAIGELVGHLGSQYLPKLGTKIATVFAGSSAGESGILASVLGTSGSEGLLTALGASAGPIALGVGAVVTAALIADGIQESNKIEEAAKDTEVEFEVAKMHNDVTEIKQAGEQAAKDRDEEKWTGVLWDSIKSIFSKEETGTEKNERIAKEAANLTYNNFKTEEDIRKAIREGYGGPDTSGLKGIYNILDYMEGTAEDIQNVSKILQEDYKLAEDVANYFASTLFDSEAAIEVNEKALEDLSNQYGYITPAFVMDLGEYLSKIDEFGYTGKDEEIGKLNETYKNNGDFSILNDAVFTPHSSGLSYVPYDGYLAELHRGERVMTAYDNANFSENMVRSEYDSNLLTVLADKMDDREIKKIIKDGFEFIGRKLAEMGSTANKVPVLEAPSKNSTTSMYLLNQWG